MNSLLSHCQLSRVIQCNLLFNAEETVLHFFISTCFDYFNSILDEAQKASPSVPPLNSFTRLLAHLPKLSHISDDVRNTLHWLPDEKRVKFEVLFRGPVTVMGEKIMYQSQVNRIGYRCALLLMVICRCWSTVIST